MYLKFFQNYLTLLWPPKMPWEETAFFNTCKNEIKELHKSFSLHTGSAFIIQATYFIFSYASSVSLTNLIIMVLKKEDIRFVSLDSFFLNWECYSVQ